MANGNGSFGALAQPSPVQVNPNPTDEDKKRLTSEWETFLSSPETQAALLQFAVSVTQPSGPGQSLLGQITGAVGAGGAAAGRVAEATRTAEQQRIENERAAQETDIRREGVNVRREAVGVQLEGLGVRRKEITSREGIASAGRVAEAELTKERIAARLGIAEQEINVRLFDAILKQQPEIDPLQFTGTPDERAQQMAAAQSAQDANFMQQYQNAIRLQAMINDPKLISDRIITAAINQGEGSVDALVVQGVPRERIDKLRGKAAEERAAEPAAVAGAAVPEIAAPTPAPLPAPQPGAGRTRPTPQPTPQTLADELTALVSTPSGLQPAEDLARQAKELLPPVVAQVEREAWQVIATSPELEAVARARYGDEAVDAALAEAARDAVGRRIRPRGR